MKKIFLSGMVSIAGTLAAGAVQAQSSVTVYGLIDTYMGRSQLSGGGKTMLLGDGGMSSSNFGIKGSEDLGGSLKANFDLNGFFTTDNGASGRFNGDTGGSGLFSRNAKVGLSGDFGKMDLGNGSTPYFISMVLFNPFGDSSGFSPIFLHTYTGGQYPILKEPLNGGTVAGGPDTRMNNMIQYESPSMRGFKVSLQYGLGEVAGAAGKNRISAAMYYINGPFASTFALERDRTSLDVNFAPGTLPQETSQISYMGGMTYDFGAAKLFGQVEQTTKSFDLTNGDYRYRTFQFGAMVPLGAGKILASWARSRITVPLGSSPYTIVSGFPSPPAGTATSGVNPTRNTETIGYDYALSKRTDIYAMIMKDQYTGLSEGTSVALGIRHRF